MCCERVHAVDVGPPYLKWLFIKLTFSWDIEKWYLCFLRRPLRHCFIILIGFEWHPYTIFYTKLIFGFEIISTTNRPADRQTDRHELLCGCLCLLSYCRLKIFRSLAPTRFTLLFFFFVNILLSLSLVVVFAPVIVVMVVAVEAVVASW